MVKDAFSAMLASVVDQSPGRDTLLVLGDFNASTGTDSDDYETCVGPHVSGTVNQNSTKFLDFARSRGLRVAVSWLQHPQAHCWTWYSNAGDVANEIVHVLIDVAGGRSITAGTIGVLSSTIPTTCML